IITGASKGLGFAIAEAFAADNQPHHFFLCARNQNGLEEAAQKLGQKQTHHTMKTYACDITNKKEVSLFAAWILQQTTRIDVLVNNTGSFLPGGIITEAEGALETMMNVNLYGAYHLTKALLPKFVQNQKGHIFNICSTAALGAYPGGSSYSISKFALMGFSKNLREELIEHNVKVTTVYPGSFYSDSWKESNIDPKRIMETADIANMIYTAAHLSPQACVEEIVLRPQRGNV
ncbi:MAG: SDR family oxidoreductase, partial [Bacteroidota bacterium]|nr:SDR family oxidoreductase [Bacteroidota bacterium]